ncbi:MAG: hypothetical protein ACF8XB_02060 [Planctomycetota bacterium JB042]
MPIGPLVLLVLSAAAVPAPPSSLSPPLAFVENRGQWDVRARYAARHAGTTAFLVEDGLRLALGPRVDAAGRAGGANVFLTFEGASDDVRLEGRSRLPSRTSYYLGDDPRRWVAGAPAFSSVRYVGVRAGVDLEVRERDGRLAYDVLLAPGADPSEVVIRCDGLERLSLEPSGGLAMHTAAGTVRQSAPVTWQVGPTGERRPVACRFRLIDERRYGFAVGELDRSLELVIDPGLEWSTFLGTSGNDSAWAIARDDAGLVTVTGETTSAAFPTTPGAFDTTINSQFGITDTYVARFDPSLSGAAQLVWSTFLGGTGTDRPNSIALGAAGEVVVAGRTDSLNFPTTPGAYQGAKGGDRDAFVARLDATGSALTYATYLGGTGREHAIPVAVDAAGAITVAGLTASTDFPATNASAFAGGSPNGDVFLARLDPSLPGAAQLLYATYFGGSDNEFARGLAVLPGGAVILAGPTASTDLPTTAGAFAPSHGGGGDDGFVVRIDPALDQVVWATYLGGSGFDNLNALAVDAAGEVIVGGWTESADFPVTAGAYDTTFNGGGCTAADPTPTDAYVARLDPTGSSVAYATFLGGTCNEGVNALAVDAGMVTVAGSVSSSDFPVTDGTYDASFGGGTGPEGPYDAYVARLDPARSGPDQLLYATYLGGTLGYDYAYHFLDLDATGAATVAGSTRSNDFPTTSGAYDLSRNGNQDAFLTRLDLLPAGAEKHGASTAGCGGPLAIGVTGMPRIGNASFGLTFTHAPAGATGLLFLGVGCVAVPVFGSGAALYFDTTQPFLQLAVGSDADGVARVPLPLPANPSLIGLGACLQFAWPDVCAPAGYSASNAMSLTVQP